MQPLQYDLRCPAAKDNSITHAAAVPSNLDAAITMRSAETDHNRISTPKRKKYDFEAIFKMIFKRKIIRAKIAQSTPYWKDSI